jgi:glycerol 3-phosphatase-2
VSARPPRPLMADTSPTRHDAASGSGQPFDGLIVDLDGVVWVDQRAVPGSVGAIAELRARGVKLIFMTNDPTGSRAWFAERLRLLGVPADSNEIVTSGSALASFLRLEEPLGVSAFVIGSRSLKQELAQAEISILDKATGRDAAIVVVGAHSGFNYDELRIATQALRGGARLYGAGRDATFPKSDGPWPGTGAVLVAVEVGGGKKATVVGKPEPHIFRVAQSLLAGCNRIAAVGDNLASDVLGGRLAGLRTILVLTGTSGLDDLASAEVTPDFVFADLAALSAFQEPREDNRPG